MASGAPALTVLTTMLPGQVGQVLLDDHDLGAHLGHDVQRLAAGERRAEVPALRSGQHAAPASPAPRDRRRRPRRRCRRRRRARSPVCAARGRGPRCRACSCDISRIWRRNSSCVSATSSSRLLRSVVDLQLARGLDHALAQVGDDVGLLEHDVDGARAERLDRGLVRLAGGHDDHRRQRRLVARELQELDARRPAWACRRRPARPRRTC